MKGKWAQGLRPRAFIWIVKDKLAACERPGGYARNHRKVRRDEELIWIRQQGFTKVLSLLDSPHNLSAYEEEGIPYEHLSLGRVGHEEEHLPAILAALVSWYRDPDQLVLIHHEEFGDRLAGVVGAFLLAAGLMDSEPAAVAVTERLTGRQLGPAGRSIVHTTIALGLAPKVQVPPEPVPLDQAREAREAAEKERATNRRSASKKSSTKTKKASKASKSSKASTSKATKATKGQASKSSNGAGSGRGRGANASTKKNTSTKKKGSAAKRSASGSGDSKAKAKTTRSKK